PRRATASGGGASEVEEENRNGVYPGEEEGWLLIIYPVMARLDHLEAKKEAKPAKEAKESKKSKKVKEQQGALREEPVAVKGEPAVEEKKAKKKKKQAKEATESALIDAPPDPTFAAVAVPDGPHEEDQQPNVPFVSDTYALYSDDVLSVVSTYTLALSALPPAGEESSSTSPVVRLVLSVTNKSDALVVSGVRFHFTQSFDVQQHFADGAAAEDVAADGLRIVGEIGVGETKEGVAEFTVVGNPRIGLCFRGDVEFDVKAINDLLSTSRQSTFEIPISVSTFMLPIPRLEPSAFASLLADSISDFSYQGNVSFLVRQSVDQSTQQALAAALEAITRATRTHIVEIVPGAASLYGRGWQGYQVAGLVKYVVVPVVEGEEGIQKTTMNVDLKCTDEDFMKGLVREVEVAVEV
ncbi:hypothetical protein BC938DRAFT_476640, partial [Jimgerdemannia flammicorona]